MITGNEKEFQKDFGRYLLMEKLGRGGMGAVYKAWDRNLNRVVAIKLLLGEPEEETRNPSTDQAESTAEEIRRFHREAQTAAKLHYPNIVQIYDVGIYNGKHYFAMEYINGLSLRNVIKDLHKIQEDDIVIRNNSVDFRKSAHVPVKLPFRRLLILLREIGYGLHYAHQHNIIHRDVKPENILIALTEDEEGAFQIPDLFTDKEFVCKIADFGLVRDIGSDSKLTMSGQLLGTPGYMSPEQARGESITLDSRTDTFSLGIVMYEIFTGRNPFQGKSIYHIMKYVLERDPVRPRKINRQIHPDIETIILKALEKDPLRRYESTKELSDDINRFLSHEPIHARPPSNFYKSKQLIVRHKEAALAFAIFILIIASVTVYFMHEAGQIRETVEYAQSLRDARRKTAQAHLAAAQELVDVALEARNHGDHELIAEKLEPARKIIWDSTREDPSFADAYCLLGYTDMLQNNIELAFVNFNKALQKDEGNTLAHYYRGQLYFALYTIGLDELASDEVEQKLSSKLAREYETRLKAVERFKANALADFIGIKKNRLGSARSAYCTGIVAYLENKPDAAIKELQRAIRTNPYYPEALLVLGVLYDRNGQVDMAIECFSRVLEDNKSDILAYYNRANLYTGKGMFEEAIADYKKIEYFNAAGYPVIFLKIGELCLKSGDIKAAMDFFSKAIDKCAGYQKARAYLHRGDIFLQKGSFADAIADFAAAKKILPEYSAIYHSLGLAHCGLGEYESAVVDYDNAIALAPYSVEAYINRGNAHKALEKYSKAREDYSYALGLNPYSVTAHYNLGGLLKDAGEYEGALKHLTASIEIEPDYTDALLERGALYVRMGQYDNALADYSMVISRNPEIEDAYFFSGEILFKQVKPAEAAVFFDKAMELNPHRGETYFYEGIIAYSRKEYDKVIEYLDKSIALEPENSEAFKFRGLAHYAQKNSEKALEDFDTSIRLNPFFEGTYYNRAIVYFYINEFAKALEGLNKAIELKNDYTDAVFLRGAVYARLNMPEAAYIDYKKTLELDPNHPYEGEIKKFIGEFEQKQKH
ncbi:MAG: tetratricopeptide repeat protein [Planctomycetes bacterium]|nr:tetratricopeptide repeat protein [Planctomycetota bacterium]